MSVAFMDGFAYLWTDDVYLPVLAGKLWIHTCTLIDDFRQWLAMAVRCVIFHHIVSMTRLILEHFESHMHVEVPPSHHHDLPAVVVNGPTDALPSPWRSALMLLADVYALDALVFQASSSDIY
jgi:hypothetical protein